MEFDVKWLLGLVMTLTALPALACKCVVKDDLESVIRLELSRSTSIVEARVTGTSVRETLLDGEKIEEQLSQWVVVSVLKGSVLPGSNFKGKSVITCCLCGLEVAEGQSYLVFRHSGQVHSLSACGNDVPMDEAKDQIALIKRLLPEYEK
jgi:hypothetical protein